MKITQVNSRTISSQAANKHRLCKTRDVQLITHCMVFDNNSYEPANPFPTAGEFIVWLRRRSDRFAPWSTSASEIMTQPSMVIALQVSNWNCLSIEMKHIVKGSKSFDQYTGASLDTTHCQTYMCPAQTWITCPFQAMFTHTIRKRSAAAALLTF